MKTSLMIAAVAALMSPTIASAMGGCSGSHSQSAETTMSCAEGMVFDTENQRCVPTTG
ncbi:MAG: carbohydrate-binding module family 14 protein [Boseongicola sp.]|nr:carbohydrate-binding module family 14 protein [Boseongicola sp.]